MIQSRKAAERGHFNHGWLDTWHSFSFADYFDPEHVGFSVLRVINDDRVAPGAGFPSHSHRDMEIITYLLDGALEHKDNMGNGSVIHPGELQRMSAGKGIIHSEFNASTSQPVHLLQIWIEPEERGSAPTYEQKSFPAEEKQGRFRLMASRDGREGSLTIHQDADIFATLLDTGDNLTYAIPYGRRVYFHLARGDMEVNGIRLTSGDALKIAHEDIDIHGLAAGSEALLFDLP